MTPTANERDRFEAWAKASTSHNLVSLRNGRYMDPETACAWRAWQAALTRERREDDALADTQRAIIEAAEQRGYERGKAEWRQQVKDAWDNLSVEKVDKPKDTGRFA